MRLMGRFPLGKSELRLQEAGTHTHTHTHTGTCQKCTLLGPDPDLLNQKPWGGPCRLGSSGLPPGASS